MSIRRRLASFMMLMIGLLFIMGSVLIVGGPLIVEAFRQSLESMNSLDAIRDLRSNVTRQRTSFNRYLLVDDPQELISFEEASQGAEASLKAIKVKSSRIPKWYEDLNQLFSVTNAAAQDATMHYKKGNKAKAYDDATTGVFPKFQKLFAQVSSLEKEKSDEAQALFEKIKSLMDFLETAVVLALGLAFVFGVVLFSLLYRAVMKPLETLKRGADEFGRGHWEHRIDLPSANEFGALAESFNTMAENVKQLQMQAVHMDRMSAVGQLAGGVAHEINNPLTAVLGQAQILLAKLKETDGMYMNIQKIEQAALRCKKIVRGLLDFSRPSQSTFEEVDVNAIVNATLELCEADLKRGRVAVEKKMVKTPGMAGNPSELQQVFINLISNSIQAMPRGGTLTIETRSHNEAVTIFDRRKGQPPKKVSGSWIEVQFRDTGVGITKDHLPRIFEPFFTTKEIGKGTGLGLAVSLGIVQKHGGDLRVESPGLNYGATFVLTLPVNRGLSARKGNRGMNKKFLLIEDDPDVSETIISVIQSFYENPMIEHIVDGKGFRTGTWRAGGWSLVILDLMMPGITGFEVCEQLRNYPATKAVPILALTGYDTLQNEEKIKAAGATGYMAKPFEVPRFMDEIKKIIK